MIKYLITFFVCCLMITAYCASQSDSIEFAEFKNFALSIKLQTVQGKDTLAVPRVPQPNRKINNYLKECVLDSNCIEKVKEFCFYVILKTFKAQILKTGRDYSIQYGIDNGIVIVGVKVLGLESFGEEDFPYPSVTSYSFFKYMSENRDQFKLKELNTLYCEIKSLLIDKYGEY